MTKTILLILFISMCGIVSAQQTTLPTGGMATGSGGTVSYSVGQVDCLSSQGAGGRVTQGVQQPYEILIVQGIEEKRINLSASVYPNPTNDILKLKIESLNPENYTFEFYDMNGKLLLKQGILLAETSIPLDSYASASYFLKVCDSKSEIKTFKITKN